MSRILVTGASGFIGRQITPLLTAAGFDVQAVTSQARMAGDDCTWHVADLLDASQREHLVRSARADALLHLAWCATPPDYWHSPENLRWLAASLDLVHLFTAHGGTRIVGVGSCAEYDWNQGYCTEGMTPLLPATLYGATKAACGSVLDAYGKQTGAIAAWARLFFLFGPFDSPLRLVPSLVRTLGAGQPAQCTAGSHVRDFLHVADAAAALVALLRSTLTGPVNIGSGTPLRVGDVARHVAAQVGRPELLSVSDGPASDALVAANVSRLRDELGWQPAHDIFSRLDETIAWWLPQEPRVTT
jgi:nucleoside-diphosphate-sugar epimerase